MRIGLASFVCKNRDLAFNMAQIERALRQAQGKAELLCFGEAWLQGFDCLSWDYAADRKTALESDAAPIRQLCAWSKTYGVALLTGYIERANERLYSSCMVIADGRLLCNDRRITRGWKAWQKTDGHYCEGDRVESFLFCGCEIGLALCGDLWDRPEAFKTDRLLIWPVYVDCSFT